MSDQSTHTHRTVECPPLDPELAALVEAIAAQVPPVTAETLPQLR